MTSHEGDDEGEDGAIGVPLEGREDPLGGGVAGAPRGGDVAIIYSKYFCQGSCWTSVSATTGLVFKKLLCLAGGCMKSG